MSARRRSLHDHLPVEASLVPAEPGARPLSRRQFVGAALATTAVVAAPGLIQPAVASLSVEGAVPQGDLIGTITRHITDGSKTLLQVALEHDLGVLEISALNRGIDVWVPGPDKLINLPSAHLLPEVEREGLVINLSELRLYDFTDANVVRTHSIGIGRDGFGTPIGKTTITRKKADPTWYPTAATRADNPTLPEVVGPGPDNPLGRHAIYLGWPTYLIHGTNKPFGVGRRVSRGCIRMYPEWVAKLFERVHPKQPVQVITETTKLGWSGDELFIEVHPDTEQLDELEATYDFTPKRAPDLRNRLLAKAGSRAIDLDWRVIQAELVERRGIPVQITRPIQGGPARTAPSARRATGGVQGLY